MGVEKRWTMLDPVRFVSAYFFQDCNRRPRIGGILLYIIVRCVFIFFCMSTGYNARVLEWKSVLACVNRNPVEPQIPMLGLLS